MIRSSKMREIKFRVWDKDRNKFSNELLITTDGKIFSIADEYQEKFEINQYTGLKDKNGKEIYEGDILEFSRKNIYNNELTVKSVYSVVFENGVFYHKKELFQKTDMPLGWFDFKIIEIIGNIYENSELLK